jgi:hypothetical protein
MQYVKDINSFPADMSISDIAKYLIYLLSYVSNIYERIELRWNGQVVGNLYSNKDYSIQDIAEIIIQHYNMFDVDDA